MDSNVLLTLLNTAFPIVLTGLVGYFVSRQQKRDAIRDEKDEQRDKGRQERNDLLKTISESQVKLEQRMDTLQGKQENIIELQDKIREGLMASLQDDLLKAHREFVARGGKLTEDEYAHWLKTYESYHDLGGNSFCDKLNKMVDDMKIVEPKSIEEE